MELHDLVFYALLTVNLTLGIFGWIRVGNLHSSYSLDDGKYQIGDFICTLFGLFSSLIIGFIIYLMSGRLDTDLRQIRGKLISCSWIVAVHRTVRR